MATIKRYKNSSGDTRYEIFVSAGTDELTGKKRRIHKRGFRDKKEAALAASRFTLAVYRLIDAKTIYLEWGRSI